MFVLPGCKVARFPSRKNDPMKTYCAFVSSPHQPLSACMAVKLERGVIFQDPIENFPFLNQKRVPRCVIFHSVLRLQLNFVGSPGISFHGNLAGLHLIASVFAIKLNQHKFVTSANCFYIDQGT